MTLVDAAETLTAAGPADEARDDHGRWAGDGGTALKDRPHLDTPDDVKAAFALHGTKYDAKVASVKSLGTGLLVHSLIVDKNGKRIGESSREIIDGGREVYHDTLVLDRAYQGKGIGAEYLRDSMAMYARAGVEKVTVEATSNGKYPNGAYTWARLGFQLDEADRKPLAQRMKNMVANNSKVMTGVEATQLTALAERVSNGSASIQDVASDGVGKAYLLRQHGGSVSWHGHLDVAGPLAASAVVDTDTVDYEAWERCELGLPDDEALTASAAPLVDDETYTAATAAVRAAYTEAIKVVAPRVLARLTALTATGGGDDHLITDSEWETIARTHVDDVIGDSVLDGVVAGAAQFAKLASPASVIKAFVNAANGFVGFVNQLRSNLDTWITNTIGEGITGDWGIGRVIDALTNASPLSPDKADYVVAAEVNAATNAGLFAAFEAAPPAALRWVSRRDLRVRESHVDADSETIPFGELFMVGGHPARFPGDPQLPPKERYSCRCELAYVEGTEARRVVGSTRAELRARAAQLSIDGRSKMNKGQLQHAVLKELCLQGLAGGDDCPDLFDKMNRTALLTVARGEGIGGRHRMSREQLTYALRQSLRGGDIAMTAQGYSTRAEFAAARDRAIYKRGRAGPGEFTTGTIPSPAVRRGSRRALFEEFGGPAHGSVPCTHCGLRLGDHPGAGLAMLVPEPIVPWSQGGSVSLSNLVPSCPSCFRARGGHGLVAAGPPDQARDDHGRWTDGSGTVHKSLNEEPGRAFDTDSEALSAFVHAVRYLDEFKTSASFEEHISRRVAFEKSLKGEDAAAVRDYTKSGYEKLNRALRHGGEVPAAQVATLDRIITEHGSPAPAGLMRAKGMASSLKELGYKVGDVIDEPAYGSWTSEAGTALKFTKMNAEGHIDATGPRAVVLRMINSDGIRSIPGLGSESETILPRGVTYEVTNVQDFTGPDSHYRLVDVKAWNRDELVRGVAQYALAAEFRDTHGTQARDGQGQWSGGGNGVGHADVPFREVKIAYRPRHPDGHADPGEVVWAQVPFAEDKTQSKDRPVLIIGRTADGKSLVGLQLSSKNRPGRRPMGQGDWDRSGRDSYLDFDRFIHIDATNYRREGSYVKKPAFQKIVDELTKRQHAPAVALAVVSSADQPRVPAGSPNGGEWTSGGGGSVGGKRPNGYTGEELDATLNTLFNTPQLDYDQMKHPKSGFMVDVGQARHVFQPARDPNTSKDSLGTEGPPLFRVFDHGTPENRKMFPELIGTEPIRHVYRGVSADEYASIKANGQIKSDQRGTIAPTEGTNAGIDPRTAVSYLKRDQTGYVLKIRVDDADKWYTINADGYLRTREAVPIDRVEMVVAVHKTDQLGIDDVHKVNLDDTLTASAGRIRTFRMAFGSVNQPRVPAGGPGGGRWTDGGTPGPDISPRIDRTAAGKRTGLKSTLGPHSHLTDFTKQDQAQMVADFVKVTGLTHLKTAESVVKFLTEETDRQMAAAQLADPTLTTQFWYVAAHDEAAQLSDAHGAKSSALGSGLLAVMSPQTPYPDNVAMAREISRLYGDGTTKISAATLRDAYNDTNNEEMDSPRASLTEAQFVARFSRETWGSVDTRLGGAIFKSHLQFGKPPVPSVDQVLTKGGEGAYTEVLGAKVVAKSGESGWKALEILNAHRDYGETQQFYDVLSNRLGDGSKVRSFYNNINNPASADFVTIDTHAAAGMTGFPGGSGTPFVKGVMTPGNTKLGMSQAYPLYQEALNRVAAKYGILPRGVQSVTWVQQRDIEWPDTVKSKYVGTGTPQNPQVSHLQYQLAMSARGAAGVRRGRVYRDKVRDLLRERALKTTTRTRVATINAQIKGLNESLGLTVDELRAARQLAAPPAVYSAERKAGVTVP